MDRKGQRGRPPFPDVLTPAEWRVAEAVRHGLSNRQIAERQGVSLDAVKFHVANTLQKLALLNRVELRHWTGVRKDSSIKKRRNDVNELLELGRIGQIARTVRDICSAKQWYSDVLGLNHLYSFGNITFFDCGGTRLFLSEGEDPSVAIIYFQVPDIHHAHGNLIERGVEFINAPHMVHRHPDGTEEWMAFFKDNEERPLAIMAQATTMS
jgi:DNA-binding CsgD family transcriptional regulator/catechol 2,3-dioxygenase-like lactoylglutathione lyase family enzyme